MWCRVGGAASGGMKVDLLMRAGSWSEVSLLSKTREDTIRERRAGKLSVAEFVSVQGGGGGGEEEEGVGRRRGRRRRVAPQGDKTKTGREKDLR